MFSTVLSACVYGIESRPVHVEADAGDGLPMFSMVGFLSAQVKEAEERVRTSLKNSGIHLQPKRITVNLSPSDLKKNGPGFDLPIALAILAAYGYVSQESLDRAFIAGELSLNGEVKGITGILSMAALAKELKMEYCIVPKENAVEAAVITGIKVIGVKSLHEAVEHLNAAMAVVPEEVHLETLFGVKKYQETADFQDLSGQEAARRAAEVAAAGMHNLLLIGPPGAGKSMLAKRLPGILPSLTIEESLSISKIYSVSGLLPPLNPLIQNRPFRAPHHTTTAKALTGGGLYPKPGEVSLAHMGILFLDELTEFKKDTLEILRQPMEEHLIIINRIGGSFIYPANFMLVGAMNPCPCGFYPDTNKCTCKESEVHQYLRRISFPLLDRIDVAIEVPVIKYQDLTHYKKNEATADIRKRVEEAHHIQRIRYENLPYRFNSDLDVKGVQTYCKLGKEEEKFIGRIYEKLKLSARAYHRILKVSRTIADLEGEDDIHISHISEAVCYRTADKKYWQN